MIRQILICQCIHYPQLVKVEVKDSIKLLLQTCQLPVQIISDLCGQVILDPAFLQQIAWGETLILACHARSIQWLLKKIGITTMPAMVWNLREMSVQDILQQSQNLLMTGLREPPASQQYSAQVPEESPASQQHSAQVFEEPPASQQYSTQVPEESPASQQHSAQVFEEPPASPQHSAQVPGATEHLVANSQHTDHPAQVPNPNESTKPAETWVPWFPVMDYERCSQCRQCLNFCLFGVYGQTQDGKIAVTNPHGCKTNCPACARICPRTAIIFPKSNETPINGAQVPANYQPQDIRQVLGENPQLALKQRRQKAMQLLKSRQQSPANQPNIDQKNTQSPLINPHPDIPKGDPNK